MNSFRRLYRFLNLHTIWEQFDGNVFRAPYFNLHLVRSICVWKTFSKVGYVLRGARGKISTETLYMPWRLFSKRCKYIKEKCTHPACRPRWAVFRRSCGSVPFSCSIRIRRWNWLRFPSWIRISPHPPRR